MPEYENQHYVQKRILNNFSTLEPNGRNKINTIDIVSFKVESRNTYSIMKEKNIYDLSNDESKILEKKLNEKLETPMLNIIEKLENIDEKSVTINRKELELIKKYFLIQLYRSYRNKTGYDNPPKNQVELSKYNIGENESKQDYWRKEMLTILDNDWDYLINSTEFVGIKKHAMMIYSSFMMIMKTEEEFIINDSGIVFERIPVTLKYVDKDEYMKTAEEVGKMMYGVSGFSEVAKKEIENNSSYIENFCFIPISPKIALVCVDRLWKEKILGTLPEKIKLRSPILENHITLPKSVYKNQNLINQEIKFLMDQRQEWSYESYRIAGDQAIAKFKNPEDIYAYNVHKMNKNKTLHLNLIMMNETFRYLCFKSKENMIDAIKQYNIMQDSGISNSRISFKGFTDLIEKNL